jgi:nuclear protein localization family protein 4
LCPCLQIEDVLAKQARIERQDKPHIEGLSFDRAAANVFQSYCQGALAFSIKRGGLLYGSGESSTHGYVM